MSKDNLPKKLQLAKPNVVVGIIVACRAKFHVLRFLRVPETKFRRLVETANDVIDIVNEWRLGKII